MRHVSDIVTPYLIEKLIGHAAQDQAELWPIPKSWRWAKMGDVSAVVGGGTPKTSEPAYFGGDVPWITPADLSGYTDKHIASGARNITESGLSNSGARLMPTGTVLFSSRAPIGYVAIASQPVATNQGFKSFVLHDGLLPDYVFYWLQCAKPLAVKLASGTTFLEISGKKAAEIPIPVPPFDEQRRIVAEIEERLSRLEAGVAALKRVHANLKRYRASALAEITRINNETLPKGWCWSSVGELAQVGTGATPKRGQSTYWQDGTVPWVTSGVVNQPIVTEPTELITETALRETNCKVYAPGTLLVAMYGEGKTRGMCTELGISAATNQALAAIQATEELRPYLKRVLQAAYERTRGAASGGVQPNLNLSHVRAIRVPLPPPKEQREVVEEIDQRLSVVDKLETQVRANFNRTDRLRQATLRSAFQMR